MTPTPPYDGVRPTLAIVDGDPAQKDGHVIVDQNIGAEADDWPLPEGTARLAGLDYALMRDEIRAARTGHAPPARASPVRAFAFFGGTDAFGAAPVVTRAMVATGVPFDLRVVGATEALREELSGITAGTEPARHGDRPDVGAGRARSPPPTSWSARPARRRGSCCASGLPVRSSAWPRTRWSPTTASSRRARWPASGRLDALRADPTEGIGVLAGLLTDASQQERLRELGGRLVDGRGRERVADAMARQVR